jgi:CheY-like chemotaxis protein
VLRVGTAGHTQFLTRDSLPKNGCNIASGGAIVNKVIPTCLLGDYSGRVGFDGDLNGCAFLEFHFVTVLVGQGVLNTDRLHRSDDALVGKKVLVVDDDVRNIFALSSVLERRGMTVLTAGTGRQTIQMLESTPDVGIVLMDIMMPEMDGYETMQVIRQKTTLRRLPIIALTAKAMKGDREKCLEAGASEYLAKPVNTDQLLSALRMWLHR